MPAVLSRPQRRLREKTWLGFELLDEEPGWHKRLETVAEQPLVHVQQSYLQEKKSAAGVLTSLQASLPCHAASPPPPERCRLQAWTAVPERPEHMGPRNCGSCPLGCFSAPCVQQQQRIMGPHSAIGGIRRLPRAACSQRWRGPRVPASALLPSSVRFLCTMASQAIGAARTPGTGLR